MKKVFSIVGICMGVMIMIIGVLLVFGEADVVNLSSPDTGISFGADFYTDEYRATAAAANNIRSVAHSMETFFSLIGFINIGFGGTIACYFGCVLADTMKKKPVALPTTHGTQVDELPDL